MTYRILIFGKNGQLGWELCRATSTIGQFVSLDYPHVDFTDFPALRNTIHQTRPQAIINAAAYTNVDQAEKEPDLANQINALAPGIIAEAAEEVGAALIHFSTDYVFSGNQLQPFTETIIPNPCNRYGQSKLSGEKAIREINGCYLILRTSWMYSLRRDNFLLKVMRWARTCPVLKIVNDQIGSPTAAYALAQITAQLLSKCQDLPYDYFKPNCGIYHLAGDGFASRFEFAKQVLKRDPNPEEHTYSKLEAAFTSEFSTPARRPLFSALDCSKFKNTFGLQLPAWQNSLDFVMAELKKR